MTLYQPGTAGQDTAKEDPEGGRKRKLYLRFWLHHRGLDEWFHQLAISITCFIPCVRKMFETTNQVTRAPKLNDFQQLQLQGDGRDHPVLATTHPSEQFDQFSSWVTLLVVDDCCSLWLDMWYIYRWGGPPVAPQTWYYLKKGRCNHTNRTHPHAD